MLFLHTHSFDNLYYEKEMMGMGFKLIAGVDEAGRGCLAGPVVACAVIIPDNTTIKNVTDSKKLSPIQREYLSDEIKRIAVAYSFSVVDSDEIDRINIRNASIKAMKCAIEGLSAKPSCVLVDGNTQIPLKIIQKCLVKGDLLSHTISCASILAKVYRDRLMEEYDMIYPQYKFSVHKGYPTRMHREIIKNLGLCPIHRKSFKLY